METQSNYFISLFIIIYHFYLITEQPSACKILYTRWNVQQNRNEATDLMNLIDSIMTNYKPFNCMLFLY